MLRTALLAGALAVIVSIVSHFLGPRYDSRTFVFGVIHELRAYMPVVTCVLLAGIRAGRHA